CGGAGARSSWPSHWGASLLCQINPLFIAAGHNRKIATETILQKRVGTYLQIAATSSMPKESLSFSIPSALEGSKITFILLLKAKGLSGNYHLMLLTQASHCIV